MRHAGPALSRQPDRAADRPVARSPADQRQLALFRSLIDLLGRDILGDAGDLAGANLGHALVVGRIVGDVAARIVSLDAADPVLQPRRSGLDPGSRQRLGIANVRLESFGIGAEIDRERCVVAHIRDTPRLGRVGDISVGQQQNRGHVFCRQPHRLDRHLEAVARRVGGNHHDWGVAVAAVNRLVEVRLLGLGGQPGRGSAALGIDDDQRQFGDDCQAQRFGLQRDTGPRARRHAERAGVGGADGGANRGDLIFGLEGRHFVGFERRQRVQQPRSRGNRIAAEDHRHPGQPGAGDEAPGDPFGAGQGAVGAGLDFRRRHDNGADLARHLGGFAEGVTSIEGGDVRGGDILALGEFSLEPIDGRLATPAIHPVNQSQRPQVLAAQAFFLRQPVFLDRFQRQPRHIDFQDAVLGQRIAVQRVVLVACLAQVLVSEGAGIDDDQPARLHVAQINLERCGVHRHQRVEIVA